MSLAMQPTAPNRLHALAGPLVVHQEVLWQILTGLGMAPYPHLDRFHVLFLPISSTPIGS